MTNAGIRGQPAARWLLLILQLPAQPSCRRVKIWRRLQALGAAAATDALDALQASDQTPGRFLAIHVSAKRLLMANRNVSR